MTNIVLIGMPGSGKTTIGRLAAHHLGREFIDIDPLIVRRAKMPIPEIFEKYGEEHFRNMECEITAEVAKKSGVVIATGGGVVLRPQNGAALRQNGRVYLISRDVEKLSLSGRPLSASREAVKKLAEERAALYAGLCDCEIQNKTTPEDAVTKLMEDYNEHSGD